MRREMDLRDLAIHYSFKSPADYLDLILEAPIVAGIFGRI